MIPDVDPRIVTVNTQWPGATPQDVEQEILIEQEEFLRGINGLVIDIAELAADKGERRVSVCIPCRDEAATIGPLVSTIRRELIDLARRYQGPQGIGAKHQTQHYNADDESPVQYEHPEVTHDPRRMAEWQDFHDRVGKLPEEEREIFDLLWYHEMSQEQAAELLEVSVRTVRRRWRSARLLLHDAIMNNNMESKDDSDKPEP